MNYSTKFSSEKSLVLQVLLEESLGLTVNEKTREAFVSVLFIPSLNNSFIFTNFNYFQENCNLEKKFIYNENRKKVNLDYIDNIKKIIISIKENGEETLINLDSTIEENLLTFFKKSFKERKELDCHAFACHLANIGLNYNKTEFKFSNKKNLQIGEFIELRNNDRNIQKSIKHFALYLGKNVYLSKFGTEGNVNMASFKTMKDLYGCNTKNVLTYK